MNTGAAHEVRENSPADYSGDPQFLGPNFHDYSTIQLCSFTREELVSACHLLVGSFPEDICEETFKKLTVALEGVSYYPHGRDRMARYRDQIRPAIKGILGETLKKFEDILGGILVRTDYSRRPSSFLRLMRMED